MRFAALALTLGSLFCASHWVMPENSVVEGFKAIAEKGALQFKAKEDETFKAVPVLHPRLFNKGTTDHTSTFRTRTLSSNCLTAVDTEAQDNNEAEETEDAPWFTPPIRKALGYPEDETVSAMPLVPSELIFEVRGKELMVACGLFLFRLAFVTEGHLFWLPNAVYWLLTSPGPVPHAKGYTYLLTQPVLDLSRQGCPAPLFGYKDFDETANPPLHCHIFLAFVGSTHTLVFADHQAFLKIRLMMLPRPCQHEDLRVDRPLWSNRIWDSKHGPDWVREPEAAAAMFARFIERNYRSRQTMAKALGDQRYFNGLGKWMLCDVLALSGMLPETPASAVCRSPTLAHRLEQTIKARFRFFNVPRRPRKDGRNQPPKPNNTLVYSLQSTHGPFEYNVEGDRSWLRSVLVYRKSIAFLPGDVYQEYYYDANLVREGFVMSEDGLSASWPFSHRPPPPVEQALLPTPRGGPKRLPVYHGLTYTCIVALPAPEWYGASREVKSVGPVPTAAEEKAYYDRLRSYPLAEVLDEDDVRFKTEETTLGLYNFQTYIQLRVVPSLEQIKAAGRKRGRPPKGEAGRNGGGRFKGTLSERDIKSQVLAVEKTLVRHGATKRKRAFVEEAQETGEASEENTRKTRSGYRQKQI